MFYRMATLKLEKLKENTYVRVPFQKLYTVTLLKQGPTADIFLEMFRLFPAKQFHKSTSDGKGVHLFSKPINLFCFGKSTVEM